MLKILRNAVADSAATFAANWPVVEPVFVAAGKAVQPIPLINTLYRRWTDSYIDALRREGRHYHRVNIGDLSFVFDCSDFTTRPRVFLGEVFEPQTTRYLLKTLSRNQTVFDIGANRGYVTMLAARRVGSNGKVFSFEPNPEVRADLEKHVALNQLGDRVTVGSEALSSSDDEAVTFYVSTIAGNSGLSSLTPDPEFLRLKTLTQENTITVLTRTLDRFVETHRLSTPIDLVKVDVEGAELLVLEGSETTLRTVPPRRWIVETSPDSDAWRKLVDAGYRTETLDSDKHKANVAFTHRSIA